MKLPILNTLVAKLPRPTVSAITLNLAVALFVMAIYNNTFWQRGLQIFDGHLFPLAVFGAAVWALTLLIITLFGFRWLQKPVLVFVLILSAVTSYYMDTLGVMIDRDMIQNAMTTTFAESKHLMTFRFISHVALFGILPALIVLWVKVRPQRLWRNIWTWALTSAVAAGLFVGLLLSNFQTYSAVIREHKELAGSYQPGAPLAGAFKYAKMMLKSRNLVVAPLGLDAKKGPQLAAATKPVLTVIVAGETARAQNFSLNGYARDTNPELAKRDVIFFHDVSSCGTATATSLPCMFSHFTRGEYSYDKGVSNENLLDVMTHAGVMVEWWDNNTGYKDIASRVPSRVLNTLKNPDFCANGECDDGIFLGFLQETAAKMTEDTVIVMHQIGSHGPAYHVRYPDTYDVFQPSCQTGEFKDCSTEEITNAYDNTIAYTDHILAQTIDFLDSQDRVLPSLIYASDHGESLGEKGLFLHGAPYFMAPEFQTKVPMLIW
ncbi:MAG: phosphoethanolamine--lipid A transferase, partial [Paracoccaceae bacterium]